MNKNRRKSKYSDTHLFTDADTKSTSNPQFSHPDKQNQAKLILLDMENDESMFLLQSALGDHTNNRNTLLQKMKAYEQQQISKQIRKVLPKTYQALSPIDVNVDFDLNDFTQEKPPKTENRIQRFSLRNNNPYKSKNNIECPSKGPENKKQQKTIFNLKRILKKLQSPQKCLKPSKNIENQMLQTILKQKSKTNKISEYCSEVLCQQIPSGQNEQQFMTQTKLNFNRSHQSVQNLDFRSKTSHQKRVCSFVIASHHSSLGTTAAFSCKTNKLTNKNTFFSRKSVTAGELLKKSRCATGFRKSTGRINHQPTIKKMTKNEFQDIFLHQEKFKEERRSRNLKNILFD